jgi:hypothetical protein
MISRRQWLKIGSMGALAAMIPPIFAATGAKKLLFVHGRGQQGQDPAVLKSQWLDTLKLGARSASVAFRPILDVAFRSGDLLETTSRFDVSVDVRHKRGRRRRQRFLVFQARRGRPGQRAGITDARSTPNTAQTRQRGPLNWE